MFYSVRQTNARFKLNLSSRTLECHISLTWYNAENRTFPIAAILIHLKVACVKKKNAVYYIQISLVPEIFQFFEYANNQLRDNLIHSTEFLSNMMKKDISANLYQKCLILCSLVTMTTYWVPDLPTIKGISGHLWCSIQ